VKRLMNWVTGRSDILLYHRVAVEGNDVFSLCVSPENFQEQVEVLARQAKVVGLDEIMKGSSKGGRVAITFDDGYADNLEAALPIAERYEVPFTVFVTSEMVGSKRGFWWDRLAYALDDRDEVDVAIPLPDGDLRIRLAGPMAGSRALKALHARLRPLQIETIERAMNALTTQLGVSPCLSGPRILDLEQLLRLADSPLVTIGAHTTRHELLAAKSAEDQFNAISKSRSDLQRVLGSNVEHFAFPFGDVESFDESSVAQVRRVGFLTACTTVRGCVARWSNRLCLSRRAIHDWGRDEFAEHLASWSFL
jgi:peptidoglycan/xylan/chitin deacetylase (PgdA/CDA1 family)